MNPIRDLQKMFRKKFSVQTGTTDQTLARTSDGSCDTTPKGSVSNDQWAVQRVDGRQPLAGAGSSITHTAGTSTTGNNALDMSGIAHTLDERPSQLTAQSRVPNGQSGPLSSNPNRLRPVSTILNEDEFDDSDWTEEELKELDKQIEKISQPQKQPAPVIAREATRINSNEGVREFSQDGEQPLARAGNSVTHTAGTSTTGNSAFDMSGIADALDERPSQPVAQSRVPNGRSDTLPSFMSRVSSPTRAVTPSLSSAEAPGTYGRRFMERERLKSFGHDISGGSAEGSRFESDHLISFATAFPYPMQRNSAAGQTAADKGMAYYEFGELHRNHISSQNTYDVMSVLAVV